LAERATHRGLVYTAVEIEAANGWFRQVPLHVVKGAGQHADAPGALPLGYRTHRLGASSFQWAAELQVGIEL
jgi:hypothetical protein